MLNEELLTYLLTFTTWDIVLLAVAGALWCYLMYYAIRYLGAVSRRKRTKPAAQDAEAKPLPGVSVVVCARNEGEHLEAYLQSLLSQDYPEYEVIVVNDGSQDDTRDVLDRYCRQYDRLHTTFAGRCPRDKHQETGTHPGRQVGTL